MSTRMSVKRHSTKATDDLVKQRRASAVLLTQASDRARQNSSKGTMMSDSSTDTVPEEGTPSRNLSELAADELKQILADRGIPHDDLSSHIEVRPSPPWHPPNELTLLVLTHALV